jgi:hypothetical protein
MHAEPLKKAQENCLHIRRFSLISHFSKMSTAVHTNFVESSVRDYIVERSPSPAPASPTPAPEEPPSVYGSFAGMFAYAMPWIAGSSAKGTRVAKTEFEETKVVYMAGVGAASNDGEGPVDWSAASSKGLSIQSLLATDNLDEKNVRAHARAGLVRLFRSQDPAAADELADLHRRVEALCKTEGRTEQKALMDVLIRENSEINRAILNAMPKSSRASSVSRSGSVSGSVSRAGSVSGSEEPTNAPKPKKAKAPKAPKAPKTYSTEPPAGGVTYTGATWAVS